ncbi:MAG TPA: crosslink repair DNA glycosylase YcaQ family protein, partial [Nocardioides sp.]|nr:crosslink repair DNA glycosylase YcaQ family protein [Nocardioides sp.]
MVHRLTRDDARRICVRAQLLDAPRPDDLLEVVRHLGVLQTEPTAPLGAPSADLVLWSRLGSAYDRAELVDLVDRQVLLEHQGFIRPAEDIALFRAEMSIWPGREPLREWQRDTARWVAANDGCRLEILDLLRREGPLPTSAFDDTCEIPWPSSGWNNNRNLTMLLKQMVNRGEVAAAGREGRKTLWDLAERIYPDDPVPDPDEALRLRNARRLRALGLARARFTDQGGEPHSVGEAGEPAVVDGVKGEWR